jgi:hypothetical protein
MPACTISYMWLCASYWGYEFGRTHMGSPKIVRNLWYLGQEKEPIMLNMSKIWQILKS